MRRHLDTLSAAFSFYGALVFAVSAVAGVGVAATGVVVGEPAMALLAAIFPVFGALFAAPFVLTGRGLRQRRAWARISGIVLSFLILSDLPIGMALGLFGLGTLFDDDVVAAFPPRPVRRQLTG